MIIRRAASTVAIAAFIAAAAPALAQNETLPEPGLGTGANTTQTAPATGQPGATPPATTPPAGPAPAPAPAPSPGTTDPALAAPPPLPADDPFLTEPFPEPGLNTFDDPALGDPWANELGMQQQQDRGFPWGLLGLLGLIGLFGLTGRNDGRRERVYESDRVEPGPYARGPGDLPPDRRV